MPDILLKLTDINKCCNALFKFSFTLNVDCSFKTSPYCFLIVTIQLFLKIFIIESIVSILSVCTLHTCTDFASVVLNLHDTSP